MKITLLLQLFVSALWACSASARDSKVAFAAGIEGDAVQIQISGAPSCKIAAIAAKAELAKLEGMMPGVSFDGILVKLYGVTEDCSNSRMLQFYSLKASLRDLVQEAVAQLPVEQQHLSVRVQLPLIEIHR